MQLIDKIAVVTGASRGIGKATAIKLGEQGATLIGTATSQSGAEAITNMLKAHNIQGVGLVLNVADQKSVDAFLEAVQKDHGVVSILVNNAGITKDNLLMRMKEEEWDDVINTNLCSIYRLSKGFLRGMMKNKWGRIINISSVSGIAGSAGQTNYAAAKSGMVGFSKSLAQEIASRGITVNVIAPGFIQTDMADALTDDQKKAILSKVPAGAMGKPEDIAATVAFLASPEAGYITGETIHVNGGMYMT